MICQQCFIEFTLKKVGYWKKRKFCSIKCNSLSQKGKKRIFDKKWRENIGKAMRGRKFTKEHKRKISEAHSKIKKPWTSKRNRENKGERSPNWKGGISLLDVRFRQTEGYKEWRFSVFERDNFTCIKCGINKCFIIADHIKPFSIFPELRLNIENGQTLCINCHKIKTKNDRRIIIEIKKKFNIIKA